MWQRRSLGVTSSVGLLIQPIFNQESSQNVTKVLDPLEYIACPPYSSLHTIYGIFENFVSYCSKSILHTALTFSDLMLMVWSTEYVGYIGLCLVYKLVFIVVVVGIEVVGSTNLF
jgi:hypothetical protein